MAAPNTVTSATKTTELSDAEFRAMFSILPQVLKLTKSLYSNADTQTIHQTSVELNAQLQKCHQVVDTTPALNLSPHEQTLLLEKKKHLLKEKSALITQFKDMDILIN